MSKTVESHYYDKFSKRIVADLAQWFYDFLNTGVEATVGRELGQELTDLFGNRRVCDALYELLRVVLQGKPAMALLHFDVQTRAQGNEIGRAALYKGLILESPRFQDVEYFVQAFIFLTAVPEDFRRVVRGFPDDFRLFVVDMTRVDGLKLLQLGTAPAATFAVLSVVAPRNLLIRGIVQILHSLDRPDERRIWTEAVF
ncbi:MAG: hypothetical protein NZ534_09825, partial [Bacteroidia bacterium]|nr:hypothetical protein [Bacteroidia bacterium]